MHNSAESTPSKQKYGCFTLLITLSVLLLVVLLGSFAIQTYLGVGAEQASPTPVLQLPTAEVTATLAVETGNMVDTAPPAAVDRLVIVTNDTQLITVAPDGSDVRQLTRRSDGWAYLFPAWSPDNRQIATIGIGRRGRENGVFVLEDSAETTPLPLFTADRHPIYLYWTPDSQSVSFIAASNTDSGLLDLHLAPRDAASESRILATGSPFYWDFSADGDTILFNVQQSPHATFAYLETASGDMSSQIATPDNTFQVPDISFDDAYIAYSSGEITQRDLIIENRGNGEQVMLEHSGKIAFVWSPTANVLAYVPTERRFERPIGPIRLLDTQGETHNLVDDDVVAFFWSPDGRKIAYLVLDNGGQEAQQSRTRRAALPAQIQTPTFGLWVIDLDSAEKRLLGSVQLGQLF
ncbi:MAG TPA: hypothetical protein ENJ56_05715, partial [Anaerolineae bacterium]|nr:hypothetical protein [Anaerolineae bacterium]